MGTVAIMQAVQCHGNAAAHRNMGQHASVLWARLLLLWLLQHYYYNNKRALSKASSSAVATVADNKSAHTPNTTCWL